ncbi:cyclase family protein [Halostreptopolyspora alba]|uniref:Cyclase family protein n=1 Tax=Halostreptopolyspora alba TaxID=2487137 RepID=A0A3N0ED09_9ACTN|nr:cyclase family protein [Nocardiopsaceae bacterium YIM 96095]
MRFNQRPEGSTWGDFGEDDQGATVGRLNLLTPEKVRQGAAEIREGRTFSLSLPLDCPYRPVLNPNRMPPVVRPTLRGELVNFNCDMRRIDPDTTDVMCDDLVVLHTQYSTHWDSLAHAGARFDADGDGEDEVVYYGGYRAGTDVVGPTDTSGAGFDSLPGASTSTGGPLGVDSMARTGLQGRGVLVDLRAHLGDERQPVGLDTLREVMAADGAEVEPGDVLCLHTGFAEHLLERGEDLDAEELRQRGAGLDGRDEALLRWITDSGLAAIVADNYAVESVPARPSDGPAPFLPLHRHCLFTLGMPLGELWRLTPLAHHLRHHGRSRFLLTAPPLNLPRATGSPVTPVATV